jgi:hypothetical protein
MGVRSVVLSGIYSNPANDAHLFVRLLGLGGPHWGCKVYTYGMSLTPSVQHAIVEAARAGPKEASSYIHISKSAADADVFSRMCRPRSLDAAAALRAENERLQEFFELARERGDPLGITLNCRVTKINSSPQHLDSLLRWFAETPDEVQLRFTTLYLPTAAPDKYRERFYKDLYVPPAEAWSAIQNAVGVVGLDNLSRRVSFRAVDEFSRYTGPACLNRLLFAAISTSGQVFPCQGIASPVYEHLSYGDLATDRFPQIWRRMVDEYHRKPDPIHLGCPRCAAAGETEVNAAFAAGLNGDAE